MTTVVRAHTDINALRDNFPFGPWVFNDTAQYEQFFGAEIQIAALTLAQLVGGVSPQISGLTTIEVLLIYPDQDVKIGLQGVNGQTSGFTLSQWKQLFMSGGEITSLNIYNTSSSTAKVFLAIGGT